MTPSGIVWSLEFLVALKESVPGPQFRSSAVIAHNYGTADLAPNWHPTIGLSDRVAVMHEGVLQGIIDRSEATQERIMEFALGSGG